jgi:hypothetical protein
MDVDYATGMSLLEAGQVSGECSEGKTTAMSNVSTSYVTVHKLLFFIYVSMEIRDMIKSIKLKSQISKLLS